MTIDGGRVLVSAAVPGVQRRDREVDDVTAWSVQELENRSVFPAARAARCAEPVRRRLLQSGRRGLRAGGIVCVHAGNKRGQLRPPHAIV